MDDDKPKWPAWMAIFGTRTNPRDVTDTFWGESRVKHDPDDTDSKDWANSEPDPDAP